MMTTFDIRHINNVEWNEHSSVEPVMDVLCSDKWEKVTYIRNEKVKCVILIKPNVMDSYACILLISKDFNVKDGVYIRRFMNNLAELIGVCSIFTISKNEKKINRWHRFLGMKLEKKMSDDLNMWVKKWV